MFVVFHLIARAISVLTSNSGPAVVATLEKGVAPWWGAMVGAIVSVIGFVCENCITILDYLSTSLLSSKTSMILTSADVSIFNLAPFWTRLPEAPASHHTLCPWPQPNPPEELQGSHLWKARKEATEDYEGL